MQPSALANSAICVDHFKYLRWLMQLSALFVADGVRIALAVSNFFHIRSASGIDALKIGSSDIWSYDDAISLHNISKTAVTGIEVCS